MSATATITLTPTGAAIPADLALVIKGEPGDGEGGGATDLAYTASPTGGTVTSSTGTDAALTLATGTNAGLMAPAQHTKLGHITVTQAVDLDAIETRVNSLDAAVILQGTWDASAGTFPGAGAAQAGWSYIVSVAGTVDGVAWAVGDRAIAIADNASTTTYTANWFKADYTDAVSSVAGRTGAVTIAAADVTDSTAAGRAVLTAADAAAQRSALGLGTAATSAAAAFAAAGAVTGSGLTMATARILGRSTASTGAVEEISVGSGLSLSGGTLSSTASGGSPGGSGTELQYRNGTSFAAVSGSSVSGSNVTFGGTLTGTDVIAGASSMHTFVGRTDQGLASLASYLVGIKVNGSTFFSSSLNNGSNAWCRGLHFGPEYYSGDSFAIMRDGTSGVMQISSGNLDTLRNIRAGTVAIGISAKTASYTVTVYDGALTADCTSGAVTFTLPALSGTTPGELHIFKKIDSSGNALNVDANGSETIDGSTSAQATSTQWGTIRVMVNADKSGWLTF